MAVASGRIEMLSNEIICIQNLKLNGHIMLTFN